MSNRTRVIRKRLIREAGKSRITDLTWDDIEKLWWKRVNNVEQFEEELYELFKWTAQELRDLIASSSKAGSWEKISLQKIKKYPRKGLSVIQNAVLDELIERKHNRKIK